MLEVHDELVTPGCPQCAVKHLSAALMHRLSSGARDGTPPDDAAVFLALAYINLVEVQIGYKSHLWFAVGCLQRAEEIRVARGDMSYVARAARLHLTEHGLSGVGEAVRIIEREAVAHGAEMALAHLSEAARELPSFKADVIAAWSDPSGIVELIERIRMDFFDTEDEAPAASHKGEEEGGEE